MKIQPNQNTSYFSFIIFLKIYVGTFVGTHGKTMLIPSKSHRKSHVQFCRIYTFFYLIIQIFKISSNHAWLNSSKEFHEMRWTSHPSKTFQRYWLYLFLKTQFNLHTYFDSNIVVNLILRFLSNLFVSIHISKKFCNIYQNIQNRYLHGSQHYLGKEVLI